MNAIFTEQCSTGLCAVRLTLKYVHKNFSLGAKKKNETLKGWQIDIVKQNKTTHKSGK